MEERRGNYEIQTEHAKAHFLTFDQRQIITRLGLKADASYIYLPFLDMDYRIHRTTASVEKREKGGAYMDGNSFNEVLTIFDALCHSTETPSLTGRWVSLADLGCRFHGSGGSHDFFGEYARRLEPYEDKLAQVLTAMGGERMPTGEPGFRLQAFSFLPVYLQYWRGDEEFPPRLRFLFDEKTTDYLFYETCYYLIGALTERLYTLLARCE